MCLASCTYSLTRIEPLSKQVISSYFKIETPVALAVAAVALFITQAGAADAEIWESSRE